MISGPLTHSMQGISLIDAVMPEIRAQNIVPKPVEYIQTKPFEQNGSTATTSSVQENTIDVNRIVAAVEIEAPVVKPTLLSKHEDEVHVCAWNPTTDLLASGSGDGTGHIWDMSSSNPWVIRRFSEKGQAQNLKIKGVSSLDWNRSGTLLSTGCLDGYLYIWTTEGQLAKKLGCHRGPIFALKWNREERYILTASVC